jgi:ATP-dependent phosphoenolpyruvate carboxykinase
MNTINKDMIDSEHYHTIHTIIQELWQREFNPNGIIGPNPEKITKREMVEHFCKQLHFCDKYKPKPKEKTSDYTESEFTRIYYMDRLRMCIINDIEKIPGALDLVNKYYVLSL